MIKIRYAHLPDGRHARAEAQGGRTVIYLMPGLSPAQRRGALRKVRRASQLGPGPRLSTSGVALAAARDSAKTTSRNGIAAIRCHPAGSLFLTALLASVIVCYVLFVSVSIQLIPTPPLPGATPTMRGDRVGAAAGDGRDPVPPASQPLAVAGPPPASADASPQASATASGAAPSQLADTPVPFPISSLTPPASPSPSPTASPTAAPTGGGDPGGLCVDIASLGVCLTVHA